MLIAILVPVGFVSAASPSIDSIVVYQNYMEANDWLILAVYNISGGNTSTSLCDVRTYPWVMEFVNGVTGTIYANSSTNQFQCGATSTSNAMRPIAIYMNASQVSSYTWGGNYSLKLQARWGTFPSASLAISNTSWKGDNPSDLEQWVKWSAGIIQAFDGVTYLDTVTTHGLVLNTDGANIYNTGIPYLEQNHPNVFETTTETVSINYNTTATASHSYENSLYNNWSVSLGPSISGVLTTTGFYFGVNGRLMGAILMFIGFISLALISKTIAFLIILGGVVIGLVPMSLIFVLVFVLAIVFIRAWFWSST
jgi:hypothetical protein